MATPRPASDPAEAPVRAAAANAAVAPGQAPATSSARRWRSAELFGLAREVEIEHGQAVYRLRLTALGKLILTK